MRTPESHRFTAAAHTFAANAWRENGTDAQKAFVPVLEQWAAAARARAEAAERTAQPDLFAA